MVGRTVCLYRHKEQRKQKVKTQDIYNPGYLIISPVTITRVRSPGIYVVYPFVFLVLVTYNSSSL